MTITRRDFLHRGLQTGCVGAGLLTATSAQAVRPFQRRGRRPVKTARLPIVDTHQHLWDLTKFKPPWLGDAPDVLRKSYTTKHFLEATRGSNVVKAVYMEVDVDPKQQVEEAEHVHPALQELGSSDGGSRHFRTTELGRLRGLHHPLQGQSLHQGGSAGVASADNQAGLVPGKAIR